MPVAATLTPWTVEPTLTTLAPVLVLEPLLATLNLPPVPLAPGRYALGSDEHSDIPVLVSGVLPAHCLIVVGQRKTVVKGLSPLTWINDGPVREGTLHAGDHLIVGPVEFRVREPFPSELPTDAAPDFSAPAGPPGVELLLQEARAREALEEALRATRRELNRLAGPPAAPTEANPAREPRPLAPAAPRRQTSRATPTTTELPASRAARPVPSEAAAARTLPQPPHPAHARVDERRAHLSGIAQSLHRRECELQRQSDDLRQGQQRLEDALARCRHWESDLQQRAAAVAAQTARLAETADELQRQRDALRIQAAAVSHRESELASHREAAARESGRLTALQERLAAQHSALSARQQVLDSREAQLEAWRRDHASESTELAALRAELEHERARWAGERAPLDEMRARLSEGRDRLEEERAVLEERQQVLVREHRELEAVRRTISREREDLEQARVSLAMERTAQQSERTTAAAAHDRGAPATRPLDATPALQRAGDESGETAATGFESGARAEPAPLVECLPCRSHPVDPDETAVETAFDAAQTRPALQLDMVEPLADSAEFSWETTEPLDAPVPEVSGTLADTAEPTPVSAPPSAVLKLRSQLAELFGFSSGEMRLAAADRGAASEARQADESSSDVLVDDASGVTSGTDRDSSDATSQPAAGGDSGGDAPPTEPLAAGELNQNDPASPPAADEPPEVSHEESVASYMEQLLSRSRGESAARPGAPAVPQAAPAPSVVPAASAAQAARDDVAAADAARRRAARSLPPEEREAMRANLDSFRELANISARTAVAKHASTKLKTGVQVKGVLALTAVVLAVLMVLADLTGPVSYQPYAFATFGLALIMVIDFVRTMLSYSRWKSVENSVNWEAETAPTTGTASDQEETELVPVTPADSPIESAPPQDADARM